MLGQDLNGRTFLDAFGGSGIMALEACSRGAGATICEKDSKTASSIKKIVRELAAEVEVMSKPVPRALRQRQWMDVFLDPPYADNPQQWVDQLSTFSTDRLIIEFHNKWSVPVAPSGFQLVRHAQYGDSCIAIYALG